MDLLLSADELVFRDEVRAFLDDAVPQSTRRVHDLTTGFLVDPEIGVDFHRALFKKGWSVPNWPAEHGGTGWSPVQRYIFDVECGRVGAPAFNGAGSVFVGPVIMKFGTKAQKKRYLPRIRSGEDVWAQGYSEPGAGSDLASLKTRAESDGEFYIVTGQKIWTTFAHKSNRIFALVRTSNEGKRQEGITFLLIDRDSPGITIRPIIGTGGDHEFNEVFFDNVRVPKENRVGEENKGWDVAKFLLEFERGGSVVAGRVRAYFAKVVDIVAQHCPDDPDIEVKVAEIGTDLDAMEMIDLTMLSAAQAGVNPGPMSSLLKLRWSQIRQSISEVALDAIGIEALRWIDSRPLYETTQMAPEDEDIASIAPRYLNYRCYTIMGGTSEVQTNILAKTLLGL